MSENVDRSLVVLSLSMGDLQAAAQRVLRRELNDAEIGSVLAHLKMAFQRQIAWESLLRQCIEEVKPGFVEWMEKVDEAVWNKAGRSVYDLPEIDFWSLYAVGSKPEQAADSALINSGSSRFE